MIERLRPMQYLGVPLGPLHGLIYRMDNTIDARRVADSLRKATFGESRGAISILNTIVPSLVAYREAATARVPVHRLERQRRGLTADSRETMLQLVRELLPHVDFPSDAPIDLSTEESSSERETTRINGGES
jgi:chromosome partitioning related protein ParA